MIIENSLTKSILQGMFGSFLNAASLLLVRVILAKDFTIEEFGIYSFVTSIYATLVIFSHLQISQGTSYMLTSEAVLNERDKGKILLSNIASIIPFSLSCIAVNLFILHEYSLLNSFLLIMVILAYPSVSIFMLLQGFQLSIENVKKYSFLNGFNGFSRLLLILLAYFFDLLTINNSLIIFFMSLILCSLLSVFFSFNDLPHYKNCTYSTSISKKFYIFSFSL